MNSITELWKLSNELLKLLYKKSIKYDSLVISTVLAASALIVSFLVQTKWYRVTQDLPSCEHQLVQLSVAGQFSYF